MTGRTFTRRLLTTLGIFLCLSVFAVVAHTPTSAQEPLQWSRPIPISGALQGSRNSSIIAQDDGNVYLFWVSRDSSGDTVFVSRYDNGAWLRPVDVLLGGPRPLAKMDGRDRLYVLYNRAAELTLADAYAPEAASVQGWRNQLIAPDTSGELGDFAFNPDGSLNVVWFQAGAGCQNCFSVGFAIHKGQTTPELSYRVLSDAEAAPQRRVQIVRAASGTLYAMWDTPARGDNLEGIELVTSTDGGASWSPDARALAFPEQDILRPLLFVDNADNLVLVYNYGNKDEVYYSTSADEGITWSEPAAIPGLLSNLLAAPTDSFAAATDSAGVTHVIAGGRSSKTQAAPGLYHVAWDGARWGSLQEIYRQDTLVENPAISIGNGNRLHISFSTRRRNAGEAVDSSQVWYANAMSQAPAATRVALPTFTPAPTSTPAPTDTPAPTVIPTPTVDLTGDNEPTPDASSVNPQLPIIAGVLPVVAILIGVVLWVTVLRRRR